ncbi:MAG: hypothetical protein FRX49_12644 [Trebouxia sp. A1-2]|nr:MAG: hypothetical protein FRX49_12644 [Trebouxia sp. A1-2]
MAAVSQQQEELAPGLLHELAVVSETLETTTREVEAEGRPTREATQLAKEKAGVPSEFTPHSSTSAATNSSSRIRSWVPRRGNGGAKAGVTTIGGCEVGEETEGGGGLAVGGGGGWLAKIHLSISNTWELLSAVGEAVTAGVVTGTVTAGVGAAVTAGVATGVAAGVSTGE